MNIEEKIVDEIADICHKYKHISKVILFGSRARGDNSAKSDIDLAVYSDSSITEFIEDIEMNTSTLLEFDFSAMKDIHDELFLEQVKEEGVIIYERH
ncbi:nucleotidyltransferase domain-containing protein [Clostridium chromiireducens]|uniref:Nucleotidyltransferase domain-containing protein n=1 Tax=Clostridium chromiireducens TaxID=225345 RepID=A0A964RT64_9CLOT|nr:nucleotidyltransferase domain-containing protein [Clostridium chromiireducens]MVX67391.1 nucleotidyltransferase domain-containing protein [Clostridium chromiireducens]